MTGRERVIAMLEGRAVDRLPVMPVTMMFAADHLGVEYGDYASDHRILVEAQIRTAEDFGFDHVSAVSDPARGAADFGAAVEWYDDRPPALMEEAALLADKRALRGLTPIDPLGGGRMHDQIQGIALFRKRLGLEKLIEGWVEGPCAGGAGLRGINRLTLDFHDDPGFVRDLFEFLVEDAIRCASFQVAAGADIIGIGDNAAQVTPKVYEKFVWPHEKKLIDGIHRAGGRARLHICGDTRPILAGMGQMGCEMVDIHPPVPLREARRQMGPGQVLTGNIDPLKVLRNGTPESVAAAVADCHRQAGSRFIVAAGCEVLRDTPDANVRALVSYAASCNEGGRHR